jgi:hypothetical protein
LPYIGYFQLIAAVDTFVIYDNIKYTKKGWINRNRWLQNGADSVFSLPLKKASDYLNIDQRYVAAEFDRKKFLNQLRSNYCKAPHFDATLALVESSLPREDRNLFSLLLHSIRTICRHLEIGTEIRVCSALEVDHSLHAQDRVLDICRALRARIYINAIGGVDLYSREDFAKAGVDLLFVRPRAFEYTQHGAPFIPWLSIVDVLMFNPVHVVQKQLLQCDLIQGEVHA